MEKIGMELTNEQRDALAWAIVVTARMAELGHLEARKYLPVLREMLEKASREAECANSEP